jgi:hypothetical protein
MYNKFRFFHLIKCKQEKKFTKMMPIKAIAPGSHMVRPWWGWSWIFESYLKEFVCGGLLKKYENVRLYAVTFTYWRSILLSTTFSVNEYEDSADMYKHTNRNKNLTYCALQGEKYVHSFPLLIEMQISFEKWSIIEEFQMQRPHIIRILKITFRNGS